MHYYSFNVADYRKDTQHLNHVEHYIYRELIDWYYLAEKPIPNDNHMVLRKLRLVLDFSENLENILKEFFVLGENGWEHGRIEAEITRYRELLLTRQASGRKGGRPRNHPGGEPEKAQNQKVNSQKQKQSMCKANQEPITNKDKDIYREVSERVISELNQQAGKRYRLTDHNRGLVIARLREGFSEADCMAVITNRVKRWLGTEQEQYLRPDTLFRPSKFEGYLNDTGGTYGKNQPEFNQAGSARLTPAQRIRAKRDAAARQPDVDIVGENGRDIRAQVVEPTR